MSRPRLLLSLLLLLLPMFASAATESARAFNISAGPADAALRQFAAQSSLEVLYSSEAVAGVRTNEVKGDMAPLAALARLLQGTALATVPGGKSGVLRIARATDPNAPRASRAASDRPNEASTSQGASEAGAKGAATVVGASGRGGAATRSAQQDGPVELSPFVVSTSSDTGWVATETLAGTRLRTNFKDVPNQLETLTKEFMDDLGLSGVQEALIYSANAENNSEYMPAAPGSQVSDPSRAGRIRGVGSATLSRNFFQVSNQTDNYNIERVTIASGPSAILFGLGSPAGILDATPARANVQRNRYSFSQQFDSEESKRTTFDANVAVLRKTLGLRLMGLAKKEYTARKPNLDREDRLYGALTFTPTPNTTLVLQGERDNRAWNRAPRIAPVEFITPWLYANQVAGSGYTSAKPMYNNTNFTGIANNVIFAQSPQAAVFIQGGAVPVQNWRNSVTTRNPATLPGVEATIDRGLDITILDPTIFPLDVNIVGESRLTRLGGHTRTAILEQKLASDLFLELAYNSESYRNNQYTAGGRAGSNAFRLSVDPNLYLPGTTTTNPYAGKYYFQGSAGNAFAFTERRDWRATLSYDLDIARKFSERHALAKWLGRHRWAGLYSQGQKEVREQLNFDRRIFDEPVITGLALTPRTQENWAVNTTRIPQYRHYFANPYEPTLPFGPFEGDWTEIDSRGNPFKLALLESGLRSADGKRLAAGQPASAIRNKVSSTIFAWQGFFLPDSHKVDRLVLTFGYRKDTAKSSTADAATVRKDFSGLYPVLWDATFDPYGATESGINRNIGIVARPLRSVSLFYNRSTTFDLNIGRYDPYGGPIPGASGEGRDYGVRVDLLEDRLALRVNRYETTIGPQRASNEINGFVGNFGNIEQRVRELDPRIATINVADGNGHGFPSAAVQNYIITSDAASKGIEVELDFTPIRNWNIRLNGGTSKSEESNIGDVWFKWVQARLPVWETVVARNGEVDAQGRPATWQTAPLSAAEPTGETLAQYYNNQLVARALGFMAAANGRATDTARSGRANFITNYNFVRGPLTGFNIGGAARWRAAPVIGYGVTTNSAGATLLDLDRAYKGKEEFYIDAALGYRGRMKAFGGFAYKLQLNVRNLLNEDDPIPVATFTTGAVAKLATIEPRTILVKFEVTF